MKGLEALENTEHLSEDDIGLRAGQFANDLALLQYRQAHPPPRHPSREECDECGAAIPQARRLAVPGVELCVECQRVTELKERFR